MKTKNKKQAGQHRKDKLQRLPQNARIHKRPLLRPPIASKYANKNVRKVVYVGTRTPFMSAFKRVKHLLSQAEGRQWQSSLAKGKSATKTEPRGIETSSSKEPVYVKATGKAIEKALYIAQRFQDDPAFDVKLRTSTVDAIDDIELASEQGDEEAHTSTAETEDVEAVTRAEDLPESRLRHASTIEILVSTR